MPKKREITVQEAGHRGGSSTSRKYGHEFYEAIGKKGGGTTIRRHGREHFVAIGTKGGGTMRRLAAEGRRLLAEDQAKRAKKR